MTLRFVDDYTYLVNNDFIVFWTLKVLGTISRFEWLDNSLKILKVRKKKSENVCDRDINVTEWKASGSKIVKTVKEG